MNVDLNKIQLKDLLSELIQTPSVNPDGDPGTCSENTGEKKMAMKVGGIFENIGAQVYYDEVEPDRPNVIAKFPGSDNKPQILLAPHLDTVGVGGMTIEPLGVIQKVGKIYGRGASDTKGTMAAMIWALNRIGKEKIKDLGIGVTFVGFMGEETGQPGSNHFAKKYHREYDFAVVGEPTNNNIVSRHKGTLWITLECKGKPAHGSTPERGENAISKMATLVNWLDKDFRTLLKSKVYKNELLGFPTLNIGRISGGTRTNIVADQCAIEIDFRLTPELSTTQAYKKLEGLLDKNGFTDVVMITKLTCEPLHTPDSNEYIQKLINLDSRPEIVGAPWFCDAAVLSSMGGIPSVAAGPGSIDQAHTHDEWISEKDLESGADFYEDFLLSASS
ncbi:MAG: M20 family metallopeptidase [Verrucomicrobiota bacterium]|nr:M20 family metallopeptidase [Verrucomicrobiota bacterium]